MYRGDRRRKEDQRKAKQEAKRARKAERRETGVSGPEIAELPEPGNGAVAEFVWFSPSKGRTAATPTMSRYIASNRVRQLRANASLPELVARPAVEMLSLSRAYGAAGSEADRLALLSAGDAMVAIFHGSAFYVSYVLGSLSGLIVSAVMLKSSVFSKTTAWLRIGSSVCDFGLFIPGVGMYISIFSVFFLFAWNLIVARRLIQLSREG